MECKPNGLKFVMQSKAGGIGTLAKAVQGPRLRRLRRVGISAMSPNTPVRQRSRIRLQARRHGGCVAVGGPGILPCDHAVFAHQPCHPGCSARSSSARSSRKTGPRCPRPPRPCVADAFSGGIQLFVGRGPHRIDRHAGPRMPEPPQRTARTVAWHANRQSARLGISSRGPMKLNEIPLKVWDG